MNIAGVEVSFMQLAGCVTSSGRKALARHIVERTVTREAILAYAASAIGSGVNACLGGLPDGTREKTRSALASVGTCAAALSNSLAPESEGGTKVTPAEAAPIARSLGDAAGDLFTEEAVAKLRELILAKVP